MGSDALQHRNGGDGLALEQVLIQGDLSRLSPGDRASYYIRVCESVGLNPAWIALIFPIDRILDMCRTVVNVTGDGAVSSFIAASEGELTPPSA